VDTVLRPLHPARVVVGENFRFGFRAAGDVSTLAELGAGEFKVTAGVVVTMAPSRALRH
jgi:riboflavin kinase/FMN adenylyltransferase